MGRIYVSLGLSGVMIMNGIDLDQFLFAYDIQVVEAARDIIDVINAHNINVDEAAQVLSGHSDSHHRAMAVMAADLLKKAKAAGPAPPGARRTAGARARKKRTDMGLTKTELGCSANGGECPGVYYKQLICPGCKEGKRGFRVRLICDEDTEHEMIL